jgi:hypothetical protein
MNSSGVIAAMDAVLPDDRILMDVARIIGRERKGGQICVEEDYIDLAGDPKIDLVTKSLFKEYFDISFGSGYRVQVAVGGVKDRASGILFAGYFFATLYYNLECQLVTVDFHKQMR